MWRVSGVVWSSSSLNYERIVECEWTNMSKVE